MLESMKHWWKITDLKKVNILFPLMGRFNIIKISTPLNLIYRFGAIYKDVAYINTTQP